MITVAADRRSAMTAIWQCRTKRRNRFRERAQSRLGGNLDRQSDCRYRARTAVRLAAGGKQALASVTSLCLAGRASLAAARRFHAAAQIAHCGRS